MAEADERVGITGFKRLAVDVLAGWMFLALFLATDDIYLATAAGVVTGIAQVIWMISRRQAIDPMQWLALVLVVGLGGSTIVTRNPTFVVLKPSIFEAALAAMMLRPGWMTRYVPPVRQSMPRLLVLWGYVWSAAWFALAASNLAVERAYGLKAWAVYTNFSPLVLVGILAVLGALVFPLARRRLTREPAGG
jgi:intracellular septation protein A